MSVPGPYSEAMSGTSVFYTMSHLDLGVLGVSGVQGHSRNAAPTVEQAAVQVQEVISADQPTELFGYAENLPTPRLR